MQKCRAAKKSKPCSPKNRAIRFCATVWRWSWTKKGDHAESLAKFAELTRDQPPYVPAFFMAGQQLARLGRTSEARELLRTGSKRPAFKATPTPPAR